MPEFVAGVLALSVNSGAYTSEIFRAGIQVDLPRADGGRTLARPVLCPDDVVHHHTPGVRVVVPPLGNELIALLKDSSLVSIIAVTDLMRAGREITGTTVRPFETYTLVALFYLCMTLPAQPCRAGDGAQDEDRLERLVYRSVTSLHPGVQAGRLLFCARLGRRRVCGRMLSCAAWTSPTTARCVFAGAMRIGRDDGITHAPSAPRSRRHCSLATRRLRSAPTTPASPSRPPTRARRAPRYSRPSHVRGRLLRVGAEREGRARGRDGRLLAGARALAAMKHVGLNVAADPFFAVAVTGRSTAAW